MKTNTITQLENLMKAVEEATGLHHETLLSHTRIKVISETRMIFYYLAYRDLSCTLQQIADFMDRRVSVVFSGIRRIHDYIRYDDIAMQVRQIRKLYKQYL